MKYVQKYMKRWDFKIKRARSAYEIKKRYVLKTKWNQIRNKKTQFRAGNILKTKKKKLQHKPDVVEEATERNFGINMTTDQTKQPVLYELST